MENGQGQDPGTCDETAGDRTQDLEIESAHIRESAYQIAERHERRCFGSPVAAQQIAYANRDDIGSYTRTAGIDSRGTNEDEYTGVSESCWHQSEQVLRTQVYKVTPDVQPISGKR